MNFALYYLYFNHICIIQGLYHCFILILGIFHKFPYFSGINPAQAENPIFLFWCFRDPNDVQMTWKFTSISFWKEQNVGAKEANKRRPEGQDRWAHTDRFLGRVGPLIWALEAPLLSIFFQKLRLDLKPTIKIVPEALQKGAPQKHRNHETENWSCRLEGENSGGALPERSPPSPTSSPPYPWWRGSSPPLDYGFV